ncbi:hypothetical protein A2318_03485 [Candidatus Uhrbacteria bacterium RIFOXYB2_FULL_45_11]|uniref:Nudix hydrolase domain-containing protein n=1 Tax=Candidatus Uhrbacteria bacterium RIFOXYB2_FULL_45_11 TaxID=1802421 RepID=A0A1F7W5E4_9BACT|nr:MAG: hypothetical protein A2318_03485 [Candidatus Uhrbacteria bacterium RIFOXYB2_FULL_45_11]
MSKMQVVYVPHTPPETFLKSIFLAGPSPRDPSHYDWRPEALVHLENLDYDGVVFVPLPIDREDWRHGFDAQVDWEKKYLDMCDVIVFWVPRDMTSLPALTTNIEYGMYLESGKVVLGYPMDAPNMRYMAMHADKQFIPRFHDLRETLACAIDRIGAGAERTGGERDVPLLVWKTKQFQSWITAQKLAGNRLDGAHVLWTFCVGPKNSFLFSYAVRVNVFIANEGRNKTNEFILARPDVSSIVAYHPTSKNILDTEIAIVREFRSPAAVGDYFVREIPGGSSWKSTDDVFETAAHELSEETGFTVAGNRLKFLGVRQVAATFSTHLSHVFACEITDDEIRFLRAQEGIAHGVIEDTERTYVEIYTVRELLSRPLTDWANLGMILTALLSKES